MLQTSPLKMTMRRPSSSSWCKLCTPSRQSSFRPIDSRMKCLNRFTFPAPFKSSAWTISISLSEIIKKLCLTSLQELFIKNPQRCFLTHNQSFKLLQILKKEPQSKMLKRKRSKKCWLKILSAKMVLVTARAAKAKKIARRMTRKQTSWVLAE